MAGLNDFISNKSIQTTTLPAWYDAASQDIAKNAATTFAAAPKPEDTVGQKAIDILGADNNPLSVAASTAQSIATGAANPWNVDATGKVTPNTGTAMGGLFQAQNDQLKQLLPNLVAAPTAGSIGSGQFGSLRGQTAGAKAVGDAQANLFAEQMKAALQNQATGVNAATAAGDLTNKNVNALLTTGQYQQSSPYTNLTNYANIVNSLQTPTTVKNQTELSPLNQIAGLIAALGGASGAGGILGQLGVKGGLQGLLSNIGTIFNTNNTGSPFFNTGDGSGGDQTGDFPTGEGTDAGSVDWSTPDESIGYDPGNIDAGFGDIFMEP